MVTAQSAVGSGAATTPSIGETFFEFSLVLGGPTFQLFRRAHLAGSSLELLHRRMLFIALFSWMPLVLLTVFDSHGSAGRMSFLRDIEVHSRFLIALPVLIAAELIVHSRMGSAVRAFIDRRIVLPQDLSRFQDAIDSAVRLRNSVPLELALLALVYTVGLAVWNARSALNPPTWYGIVGGRWQLTPAGYWYVFVSMPVSQFILLRWYMRLFVWFRFLWQVSRMNLNLFAAHPDRCAGLAFLGKSAYAFCPILFAQGAILAGIIATRVFYNGESLLSFKGQALGFVAFFVTAMFSPLLMFSSKMAAVKRKGLADYGLLAQRYVERFDSKWVRGGTGEELLGTSDIQSLADLANSYDLLRGMRTVPVPFGLQDIGVLSAAAAAPLLPLLLTTFSPEELITRIIKMAF